MSLVPTKRKPHRDYAGYVSERRSRFSGGHIIIVDCKRAEVEGSPWCQDYKAEGGRYMVLCDTHGTLVYSSNQQVARECMKDPTTFCEICRDLAGQGDGAALSDWKRQYETESKVRVE